MEKMKLSVYKRDDMGKERVKQLRKRGFVPGVVYGHGEETIAISLAVQDFKVLLDQTRGESPIIILNIESDGDTQYQVIIKEIQRDCLTSDVLHVDFQHLHRGEKVMVHVPIHVVGTPIGVKEGGILDHHLREVEVRCVPSKIPEHLEADITHLAIGDSLHIRDIMWGDLEPHHDPEATVVSVLSAKGAPKKEEEVEELAEPEIEAGDLETEESST